jgi:DNA ligase-1
MGRGQFELVTATVRDVQPDTVAWQRVRFMVFDLPSHQGTFTLRLQALQRLLANVSIAWMQPVEQFKVTGQDDLDTRLREVISAGGEGLMLHRGDSMYRAARSDDLLKVKPVDDAEARVTGHLPGKGKYQGLLGALQVETPEGLRFRLGSGFTDEQRRSPPPIGSQVTYRYQGKTAEGVPRFAVFLRVRDEGIR